jgi:pyruvate,water dikinase
MNANLIGSRTFTYSLAEQSATLETVGGKGASLARMARAGMPVPDGFHITTAAYRAFVDENALQPRILEALRTVDPNQPATLEAASAQIGALFAAGRVPTDVAAAIEAAYMDLARSQSQVAVRSSATAEDLPGLSFAGQQETYLNVQGVAAVLEAVQRCWASLWTARAIGYRAQHGIEQDLVSLAVVVQTLVPAEVAGIMFTAHPVTGQRDQIMISASWGLGEAVVGGAVTPDTFTVDKATGRVLERQIADKQVMTARVEGGTEEQPTPEPLRRAPALDDEQAAELAQLGAEIEQLYERPMDVEWTLVGGADVEHPTFAIVQARPITVLPEPETPPPTEWPMPNPKGHYVRASIIDLMPDPISPLFATMGFSVYSAGLVRAMTGLLPSSTVLPEQHLVTINSYAYQDAQMSGPMIWWSLTAMIPGLPRMLRNGVSYWRENGRAPYVETTRRWEGESLPDLSTAKLLEGAKEIVKGAMYNLTAQMTWMGACAGSEMLFSRVYDRLIKRAGEPDAPALLMGYDSIPIRAEKSLYDLAAWCRARDAFAAHVLSTPSSQLVAQLEEERVPASVAAGDWQGFKERFQAHVQQFGHIVYDLDIAKPLPLDDPAPMLEMVKLYLRGEGADPHERQKSLETRRVQTVESVSRRVKGIKRWAFRTTLRWAQSLAEIREDALADIGLGYPVLRRMLRELGRRLVEAQAIEQPEDVFWLRQEELEQAVAELERGEPLTALVARVQERQAFQRAARRVTPPPVLPPSKKRVMGFNIEGIVATDESKQIGDTLKGTGTSAGQVTAPACVLHGPEDFGRMQPGHILVASITTPAWTPLFAMAAGIVTDVGGPLSHGSIVAREYGIPAVLGTGVATRRIHNGQVITVDGAQGTVLLENE